MKEIAEKWCFVGVSKNSLRRFIRRAIVDSGYRSSSPSGLDNTKDVLQRRVFFCLFLDLAFFKYLQKAKLLTGEAYLVLMVDPTDIPRALKLQSDGKIHDWIEVPADVCQIKSVLLRAKNHIHIANELLATKTSIQIRLKNDIQILLSGDWEKQAQGWLNRHKESDQASLIVGERGSGKHLIARHIHAASSRSIHPWIEFSCDGHSPDVTAVELFGQTPSKRHRHRRSAKRGRLTAVGNGVLYLDRVDLLPMTLQKKVAAALRRRRFSPVGGGDSLPFYGKLVCSALEDLNGRKFNKRIHGDLLRCFKPAILRIPPLRERKSDFGGIASGLLDRIRRKYEIQPMKITKKAMDRLSSCHWQGNLRELEAVLWASSILADKNKITLRALNPILNQREQDLEDESSALEELVENRLNALFSSFDADHLENLHSMILDNVEKPLIKLVLEHTKNSQTKAARILGINRNTLRRKMKDFQLS